MKFLLTAVIIIFFITGLSGQNLIGFKGDEIKKYMKENHGEMHQNKVVNDRFLYLKYSDDSESQTILFFLGADSVCMGMRIICDGVTRARKEKEYNSLYKKNGNNRWIENRNGKNYMIEITEERWANVINIKAMN